MTKTFLVFLNLFFISSVFAQGGPKMEAKSGSLGCVDCSTPTSFPLTDSFASYAQEFISKINSSFVCKKDSDKNDCLLIDWLKWKHKSYAENCKGFFLDEQGKLGHFSKITAGLMAEDIKNFGEKSIFTKNNSDFDKFCPHFKNFTTAQKIAFHSWIFELTAFPESTCNINVKPNTHAPTTKAVCLYQLEDRPSIRKWRSNGFTPQRCAVSASEILTVEGCTGCAFDEYKRKTKKDGTPFGIVNNTGKRVSSAYWASHNPLAPIQQACFEKYYDAKLKKPFMTGKKATYLLKCPGSNNEWLPRYKFFGRIQRFPLCGTEAAQAEIEGLKIYQGLLKK